MTHRTKLLATGHRGFVGTCLSQVLQAQPESGVTWCPLQSETDLLDPAGLRAMLAEHQPDWVVHLAAQSHVPASWIDPATTLSVNVCGTANLLDALTQTGFRGRFLYVSSAAIYGSVDEAALPLTEETPPAPRTPYASSKVAGEVLCLQWARTRRLDVVIARPFNHTGAGQRADFALPAFAREIAAIKRSGQPGHIPVGDLEVTRDFLDVRDVVAAYLALLAQGCSGETYNVCSGREVHLGEALQMMIKLAGVEARITSDPARMRHSEQKRMRGSHDKLTGATGWQPRIGFRETVAQLIDYWTAHSP